MTETRWIYEFLEKFTSTLLNIVFVPVKHMVRLNFDIYWHGVKNLDKDSKFFLGMYHILFENKILSVERFRKNDSNCLQKLTLHSHELEENKNKWKKN